MSTQMSTPPKAPPIYKLTPLRMAAPPGYQNREQVTGQQKPPSYRPNQIQPAGVQLKPANSFRLETRPAPPVYRPQPLVSRVQLKPADNSKGETRPAPPVYRPQQPPASTAPMPKPLISRQSENAIGSPRFVQRRALALPKPLAKLSRNPVQGTGTVIIRQGSATHVIQRASLDSVEAAKLKIKGREKKKENMAKFAATYAALYLKPKKSAPDFKAEFKMVDSLSFGGNRSSAAVITNASGDEVYVSGQGGGASKAPEEMWDLSGAEVIATDCERSSGLHAEMQTIVMLLREWAEIWSESTTAAEFLVDRLGGGKAVAKGKGCCQLCAAILLKLGVKVAFIEPSKYEATWQDPFEFVGLENPWFKAI